METGEMVGPLRPEYAHNLAYRRYWLLDPSDGRVWKPEFYVEGECTDHRFNTGLRFYLQMELGDVLVRVEHGPHPGAAEFAFVQFVEDGWMDLSPQSLAPEHLKELADAIAEAGSPNAAQDLRRVPGLWIRSAPDGW
jgi:hypothetical protein